MADSPGSQEAAATTQEGPLEYEQWLERAQQAMNEKAKPPGEPA